MATLAHSRFPVLDRGLHGLCAYHSRALKAADTLFYRLFDLLLPSRVVRRAARLCERSVLCWDCSRRIGHALHPQCSARAIRGCLDAPSAGKSPWFFDTFLHSQAGNRRLSRRSSCSAQRYHLFALASLSHQGTWSKRTRRQKTRMPDWRKRIISPSTPSYGRNRSLSKRWPRTSSFGCSSSQTVSNPLFGSTRIADHGVWQSAKRSATSSRFCTCRHMRRYEFSPLARSFSRSRLFCASPSVCPGRKGQHFSPA